ncbi:MAG: hypothetical protein PHP50_10095 [Lachnospiraceae bacterium]|nr:hypothetical protein [Lachnospiraceae bacterium]
MSLVMHYKPGDEIIIMENFLQDEDHVKGEKKPVKYRVIRQYPHFVLCKNKNGIKRSILNADLYVDAKQKG